MVKKNKTRSIKGVILAGGRATRLHPLTLVTNKHLLPVYDKPMIYYAVEKLVSAGIDKIMIITSPHHIEDFVNLLGSGQDFRAKGSKRQTQIIYGIQNKPSGIAQGLWIAKDYIGEDNCLLYLGDNIFEDDISIHIKNFKSGASIFLKEVEDPERFGIANIDKKGIVKGIEEKPKIPKSNLAVTGMYLYDNTVFEKLLGQPKSARGEYEITYINNKYIKEGTLGTFMLKNKWFDAGTFDSLMDAANYMAKKNNK